MGGPICLFCLLVKPCSCSSGPWREEGARAALQDMNPAAVLQLFRRVLEATMGTSSVNAFYAAALPTADKPGLGSIGGKMLADRSFAPLVQNMIKDTLTDAAGDREKTRMVRQILQAYTQALCDAVQPPRTPSA